MKDIYLPQDIMEKFYYNQQTVSKTPDNFVFDGKHHCKYWHIPIKLLGFSNLWGSAIHTSHYEQR